MPEVRRTSTRRPSDRLPTMKYSRGAYGGQALLLWRTQGAASVVRLVIRGTPTLVTSQLTRGNVRLYLSEHKGDARPNTLIHLYVKDIDAVSLEFGTLSTKRVLLGGSATWKIRTATGCV